MKKRCRLCIARNRGKDKGNCEPKSAGTVSVPALLRFASEPACDRIPHTLEDVLGSVPGIFPGAFTGHVYTERKKHLSV